MSVVAELGIDLWPGSHTGLTRRADLVVTMGCGDERPSIPGKRYVDWELATPRAGGSTMSAASVSTSAAASTA